MSTIPAALAATNVCPHCGARFRCGMEGGDQECWCSHLPPLPPLAAPGEPAAAASCLCPTCLKGRLSQRD